MLSVSVLCLGASSAAVQLRGAPFSKSCGVGSRAARSRLLRCAEELSADQLAALFASSGPGTEPWLEERDELLGDVSSHELLRRDEAAGLVPPLLDAGSPFVFVDELRCIGCRYCAEIARSTFMMTTDGLARAYQQGADEFEVVDEAIAACPCEAENQTSRLPCRHCVRWGPVLSQRTRRLTALDLSRPSLCRTDCIHFVQRGELQVLEEYREVLPPQDLSELCLHAWR